MKKIKTSLSKSTHPLLKDRPLLILLDYDGTLTDFKKNPEHSHISNSTRQLLYTLRRRHPVVMVTGRYIASLEKVSGLKSFSSIGTHGFEAKNLPGGLRFTTHALQIRYKKEAARLWRAIRVLQTRFPGIHIERKPYSSTLHFRGINFSRTQIKELHREFEILYRASVTPRFWHLQKGKKMIEVMPKGFSKGKSVKLLLKHFPGHVPLYAGDDTADISVFKILGKKGLRIAIGNRVPKKHYDLQFESPKHFIGWLKTL